MERRKFIIGAGALATGSSAAVGTGAWETASAPRTANVNISADAAGFVGIQAVNNKYASGSDDGELSLNFDGDSGFGIFEGDGEGINPNSTYDFGEVFRITHPGGAAGGNVYVVIEATGFSGLEDIELTADSFDAGDNRPVGESLLARDYDDPNDLIKLLQPDAVDVAVEMTTGSSVEEFEGTLTIHAAAGPDRGELSDIL